MLSYLSVTNFAIIENIEVEFNSGMTALTGETGAGKSLLIDAIGLLLGDRATSNIVRTGSDKAVVEGVFHHNNPDISILLQQFDIEDEGTMIIKRQITPSNNNVIKINHQTVTLTQLKQVASLLADIHTQFDTHRLINQDTYLELIDGFQKEKTDEKIHQYQEALRVYKQELKKCNQIIQSSQTVNERLDLIQFQKNEIESFNLTEHEEEELKDKVSQMNNFDTIFKSLNEIKSLFNDTKSLDYIYQTKQSLESIDSLKQQYNDWTKRIEESYYELLDVSESIDDEIHNLDFDPKLLETYQDRLHELESLQRKYRKTIPEILAYYEQISEEIDQVDSYEERIEEQKRNVKKAYEIVIGKANEIRMIRVKTAKFIEETLLETLSDLELKNTQFEIRFHDVTSNDYMNGNMFLQTGLDEVDFLMSTNIGEPLKSLSKTASGGEMSRIMLGLKTLLVHSLRLSLIIFDEIDTGVSGYVANQVAKKMKEISNTTQVICITHIPQVAALSDHHLYISKVVERDRTKAQIKALYQDDRVYEIASMISGEDVSETGINSAKELLQIKK